MSFRIFVTISLAVSIALLAADAPIAKVTPKPEPPGGSDVRSIAVSARVIEKFHKDGVTRRRIGKLIWRGGLVLSSNDRAFGGYSGLEVSPDGRQFMAVSDAGTWLTGEFVYGDGRLRGVRGARVGAIKALQNRVLRRRSDRDAEAIRLFGGTLKRGRALVSFEINQRIGVFPIHGGVIRGPNRYLRPARRLPVNKGLEAIALVKSPSRSTRRLVAFAERSLDRNGHHRGWIWNGLSGHPRPVALTNPNGFDITDAVGLEGGDLLVLERRFRWSEGVKMRLRRIKAARVKAGSVMSGVTLVRADMRYEIDNMEGVAVHRAAKGETIVTLISDNNFNTFLQRTLVLQFALPAS